MRFLIAIGALVAALAAPTAAPAGGWAAVELDSLPSSIEAGDTWTARFTVLRHGVTPTDGAEPMVTIVNTETSDEATFTAAPAGETGVYEAAVEFPESGSWRIDIDNGLAATGAGVSQTTKLGPVTIADGPGGSGSPGDETLSPLSLAGLGLLVLVAAAAAVFTIRRARRLTPAS